MTLDHASLLLAALGGVCLLAAWLGRRTGDAPRDTLLMTALGAGKLVLAATVRLAAL